MCSHAGAGTKSLFSAAAVPGARPPTRTSHAGRRAPEPGTHHTPGSTRTPGHVLGYCWETALRASGPENRPPEPGRGCGWRERGLSPPIIKSPRLALLLGTGAQRGTRSWSTQTTPPDPTPHGTEALPGLGDGGEHGRPEADSQRPHASAVSPTCWGRGPLSRFPSASLYSCFQVTVSCCCHTQAAPPTHGPEVRYLDAVQLHHGPVLPVAHHRRLHHLPESHLLEHGRRASERDAHGAHPSASPHLTSPVPSSHASSRTGNCETLFIES